jgi:hypothetical protein
LCRFHIYRGCCHCGCVSESSTYWHWKRTLSRCRCNNEKNIIREQCQKSLSKASLIENSHLSLESYLWYPIRNCR